MFLKVIELPVIQDKNRVQPPFMLGWICNKLAEVHVGSTHHTSKQCYAMHMHLDLNVDNNLTKG